ncbi:MAG: cobalamin-dependent protein [Actinomycetia bacterium]|nr:cobalamin-dependent protein [Actinomycetes bacterium]
MTLHQPRQPIRIVTAASLFDGHDAAINVMRRILQDQGAEVIHLGHDRSVHEVVVAALQEDATAVAISSYQGGHVEYFSYLREELNRSGAEHIRVYGGGGGVIVPAEVELLASKGVRIFTPADGQQLGLPVMINSIIVDCDHPTNPHFDLELVRQNHHRDLARAITAVEQGQPVSLPPAANSAPVVGITGTGGAGKSSVTDELLRRLQIDDENKLRIAVLAVDPSRRRGGGALLGDRIRFNALRDQRIYFRSVATRNSGASVTDTLPDVIDLVSGCGFDLVIVETPGLGQGDTGLVDLVDLSLYVMTAEYGAASQLEKIGMLDCADAVLINKYERSGSEDARRDVARQLVRNRQAFGTDWQEMPVFGTSAAQFDDSGVTHAYRWLRAALVDHGLPSGAGLLPTTTGSAATELIPRDRQRYLSQIATVVRGYHIRTNEVADLIRRRESVRTAAAELPENPEVRNALTSRAADLDLQIPQSDQQLLDGWTDIERDYRRDELVTSAGARESTVPLTIETLSGTRVPRVALPRFSSQADIYRWLRRENLPGRYPFTAAVFPFRRTDEDPARMFAGEGDAFRTNRRFHLLASEQPATRLSTAFDSVTLYGRDPAERPDIYGKVGTAGVSIATLADMKELYRGFDLTDSGTSVSMTINGPAPAVLAMFFNTAIDQQIDIFRQEQGRDPDDDERSELAARTVNRVRGTVQADILKEDQGQNTCLFSTEFSLRCMADVQQWFIDHAVRNFYSVSISGYHIAEAGANPISQLAFTLANAFTYLEIYRARGMSADDVAANLSFFFSNGMDAEYAVLGRVARRIWAIALREVYGADERSQRLKYHVQTSGRSLHAQEMSFNDIRTTLQALLASYDNCNSLHTNAYDEAVTTPTPESVRRALAIQMIINREWGLSANENPQQGSFIVEELTELVEDAVLAEFDRLSDRGGVLGAMETGYQRGRIQDESLRYEQRKHSGALPIVGVNTFLGSGSEEAEVVPELMRATEAEKRSQLNRLATFTDDNRESAALALAELRRVVIAGENVFAELMRTVRVCSLGQITEAFFDVGGQYRRNT